jgi:hypothetical protein
VQQGLLRVQPKADRSTERQVGVDARPQHEHRL